MLELVAPGTTMLGATEKDGDDNGADDHYGADNQAKNDGMHVHGAPSESYNRPESPDSMADLGRRLAAVPRYGMLDSLAGTGILVLHYGTVKVQFFTAERVILRPAHDHEDELPATVEDRPEKAA